MPHDSALYDTVTGHNSPAQTKAAELAQQGAVRDAYQRAARNETRGYETLTGQPDGATPVLASINPTTAVHGTGTFSISVTGSNFNEDSKIFFGATELVSNWDPTGGWGPVPAAAIASAGTVQVTVKTDSSVSNAKPFTVT